MQFSLEVLQAKSGDCLILHWGDRRVAVIDGGPDRTYEEVLKPRLRAIADERGLESLQLDLVMVSHIDNDHIVGVRKLFSALRNEVEQQLPNNERPILVDRLWHNTFDDLLGPLPPPTSADHDARYLCKVLAGHADGRALRDAYAVVHEARRIRPLNAPFGPSPVSLITDQSTPSPVDIAGLKVTVIGPQWADVVKLKADFDKYLKRTGAAAESALAALYADTSVTNLSSLICLVEHEGKTILLTGDARGDKILEGLSQAGRLSEGALELDILKVPHHGSCRNVSPGFFKALPAAHYVISANGQHGNPDRQTLEWLIDSRTSDEIYTIHFTYGMTALDQVRRERQGATWREETDSISELMKSKRRAGFKFRVVEGGGVVRLADEGALIPTKLPRSER